MAVDLRRRNFVVAIGGGIASTLVASAARAQQGGPTRRIGALMPVAASDPEAQARYAAFLKELNQLGWKDGDNVRVDIRWSAGNAADTRNYAAELVALAPDVILASGSATLGPLLDATHAIPIVFAIVPDPVGAGFVAGLSRPGGNATGFLMFEYSLCGKWLELLKEISPKTSRALVFRDAAISAGVGQFAVIQAAAPSVGLEVTPANLRASAEIENAVAMFAQAPNGGLILTSSPLSSVHRNLIISLASRYKLPTVYVEGLYVAEGGLISYGPSFVDQFRRAASYVDRILKGEKPDDLPVQAPTKYELTVNLKTAKALGLVIPATVLARADEVIE